MSTTRMNLIAWRSALALQITCILAALVTDLANSTVDVIQTVVFVVEMLLLTTLIVVTVILLLQHARSDDRAQSLTNPIPALSCAVACFYVIATLWIAIERPRDNPIKELQWSRLELHLIYLWVFIVTANAALTRWLFADSRP